MNSVSTTSESESISEPKTVATETVRATQPSDSGQGNQSANSENQNSNAESSESNVEAQDSDDGPRKFSFYDIWGGAPQGTT